jgi:hypothetical protein
MATSEHDDREESGLGTGDDQRRGLRQPDEPFDQARAHRRLRRSHDTHRVQLDDLRAGLRHAAGSGAAAGVAPSDRLLEDHGDSGGSFDLGAWNVPFTAAPPPSDQIIELPH